MTGLCYDGDNQMRLQPRSLFNVPDDSSVIDDTSTDMNVLDGRVKFFEVSMMAIVPP